MIEIVPGTICVHSLLCFFWPLFFIYLEMVGFFFWLVGWLGLVWFGFGFVGFCSFACLLCGILFLLGLFFFFIIVFVSSGG